MLIPSISILAVGGVLAVLLMAADWFVWGFTYSNHSNRGRVTPAGVSELADRFLHRLIAANESVLPCAALKAVHEKPAACHGDDGGFKHVA